MATEFHFPRPELALQYTELLTGTGPFGPLRVLMVSAPRRTGKTTFLRNDLVPALQNAGVLPVYADLWEDRDADPNTVIGAAIDAATATASMTPGKNVNIRKLGAFGLTVELEQKNTPEMSLTAKLGALIKRSNQQVVLMIDEAQQSLRSENGLNAMFALKSARDTLNHDGHLNLSILLTGSSRDKLHELAWRKDMPFYGSQVNEFPVLGAPYVDAITDHVNRALHPDYQFDSTDALEAFRILSHRPEFLRNIMQMAAFQQKDRLTDTRLISSAEAFRAAQWPDVERRYNELTSLQRALLDALIDKGDALSPYAEEVITHLAHITGETVTHSKVQKALVKMQHAGIIWNNGQRAWRFEDDEFEYWLRQIRPSFNK